MGKINELKVEQLKKLLRERDLATTGSRDQLIQRLSTYEDSDEVDIQDEAATKEAAQTPTITQLQEEMKQLREMMVQFLQTQNAASSSAPQAAEQATEQRANSNSAVAANGTAVERNGNEENILEDDGSALSTNIGATLRNRNSEQFSTSVNMRQASVKEISNTLPEFDPTNNASITVEQFIDRVNKVANAYKWEDKFLLLAVYTRLKGAARMWLDASPTMHIT